MSSLLVLVARSERIGWTEAITHRVVGGVHRGADVVGVMEVAGAGPISPALRSALSRVDGLVVAAADPSATRLLTDRLATCEGAPLTGAVALAVVGAAFSPCVPLQGGVARPAPHARRLTAVLRDLGAVHVLPEVVLGVGDPGHNTDRLTLSLSALTDMTGAHAALT